MKRLLPLICCILLLCLHLPDVSAGAEKKSVKKPVQKGATGKKVAKGKPAGKKSVVKKKTEAKKIPARKKVPVAAAVALPAAAAVAVPAQPSAVVTEIRHWPTPDYTRIAVSIDKEAQFEAHRLPAGNGLPPRLYIDIRNVKLAPGVRDLSIGDGLLKTARIAQYRADTVRVVLDLESIKDYKIFTFSDPYRIIIDVKGERREELTRPKEPVIQNPPAVSSVVKETGIAEEKPKAAPKGTPAKIRRIVIDAGHGGHDPGAVGARGTREKDVVLQIALKLARKLREDLGLDVVLTRSTDVFLELQERTAIANQVGADLFVSVHANAALNRASSGIETYYLNLAKTEKAAQLAAKENGTSLEKVSLLQAVLFDLMANYKINDSAHLAEEVQKALHRKVNGHFSSTRNLGVKQGPFYVLVGATMPSILVETAFLSNEREEERLNDPSYQDDAAEGIAEGVRQYISSIK